jgi:TnpA family transposase
MAVGTGDGDASSGDDDRVKVAVDGITEGLYHESVRGGMGKGVERRTVFPAKITAVPVCRF